MNLREAQIQEIKNLDLIYIFSTDSLSFSDETNKYIGATIVFNNDMRLQTDYKDKYFSSFIKKILERYELEKDKRNIILLGTLTKDLINNSSIVLNKEDDEFYQDHGISAFNTSSSNLMTTIPYIKDVLGVILPLYENYSDIRINDIKGMGKKYVLSYNLGLIEKKLPLVISYDSENINFYIGNIDGIPTNLKGTLVNDSGVINIDIKDSNKNLDGTFYYDASGVSERKLYLNDEIVTCDNHLETLLDSDMELIDFYCYLCVLDVPKEIIKTSNCSYLMKQEKNLQTTDDMVLFSNCSSLMTVDSNKVKIEASYKNCLNKCNNQIKTVLDYENIDILFQKIKITDKSYVVAQIKNNSLTESSYKYVVYETEDDISLSKPFKIKDSFVIDEEVSSLEKVEEYIKIKKRGVKR